MPLSRIISLSFIKKMLGAPTDVDPSQIHVEIEKLKEENARLTKEIKEKSERLEQLKNEAN